MLEKASYSPAALTSAWELGRDTIKKIPEARGALAAEADFCNRASRSPLAHGESEKIQNTRTCSGIVRGASHAEGLIVGGSQLLDGRSTGQQADEHEDEEAQQQEAAAGAARCRQHRVGLRSSWALHLAGFSHRTGLSPQHFGSRDQALVSRGEAFRDFLPR